MGAHYPEAYHSSKQTQFARLHIRLKALITFLSVLFLVQNSLAQQIQNIRIELQAQDVLITYDLAGDPDQKFIIRVFSSYDEFVAPLDAVTGYVGENVTAGANKQILWAASEELPEHFDGDIRFRIEAEVVQAIAAETQALKFSAPTDPSRV